MAKTNTNQQAFYAIAAARIGLGFIFLWAFFDKLIGLGFATCRAKTDVVTVGCKQAWLHGGSPTTGFLKLATKGPFVSFYHNLAGHGLVDWLFMLSLLLIGAALVLGIGIRLAAVGGSLLLLMMWSAALWPANNPVLDEHIIYILLLMVVLSTNSNQKWGLGSWWAKQPAVKRLPLLV